MTEVPQPQRDDSGRVRSGLPTDTLDEIDPPAWGPAPADADALVRRAHALRTVPVAQLGIEDLRLLISQDVARPALVPVALGMLRFEPLLEGDLFPGDLLHAVMCVPDSYWRAHPDALALLRESLALLDRTDPSYPKGDDGEFEGAVERFRPEA